MRLIIAVLCAGLLAQQVHALSWQTNGAYRFFPVAAPAGGKAGFTEMPAASIGIAFTNVLSDQRGITNQIYMNGSGVAAGDVDGDGRCDLYFCGLDSRNVLYRNLGDWKFQDVTASSGTSCGTQASTGAAFADVDGDLDLDLLITGVAAGVRLFVNDGKGRFTETTRAAGLASQAGSTSMALADIDNDGDLDLYVANYRTTTLQDEPGVRFRVGTTNNQRVLTHVDNLPATAEQLARYSLGPSGRSIIENGEADFLYRNDGRGNFSLVSWTDGTFLDEDGKPMTIPYDWGLSVMFRDLNRDRAPDIYVCNDSDSPDRIWINDRSGKFRALPELALRQTCLASMGVDFADINRDGLDDFFVADMLERTHAGRHSQMADWQRLQPPGVYEPRRQFMRNMLYLNRGDGTYAEIAQLSGVDASGWSWMPAFLDVDLDGYEDLLITTGLERNLRDADARKQIDEAKAQRQLSKQEFLEMRRIMSKLAQPNIAFRNRGDLTFEDASQTWGFDSRRVTHGMTLADLDNDGDLDLAVNCMNEPALVYRNNAVAPRLAVRLKGRASNTRGVGARITVTGGPVVQAQEVISGGRYLSADEGTRVFAAGSGMHTIEVLWRDGTRTVLTNVPGNRVCEVTQSSAAPSAKEIENTVTQTEKMVTPLFQDTSNLLNHRHWEEAFNDFDRQPLLPRQFTQLGPGLTWGDVDEDGWDDLVLPSGRGGELGVLLNGRGKPFTRISTAAITGKASDDQTAVLISPSQSGATLMVATSGIESGGASSIARYTIWAGGVETHEALSLGANSPGPLAMADVNGDGDLDLFAGGRISPGRYPEPVLSQLFLSVETQFSIRAVSTGMVSGAVFTDLTGDGLPELVLACDWGPIQIFRNHRGEFRRWDLPALAELTGWWNGVAAGDFDGDGRMDFLASNWGRNSKYQYYAGSPLRMRYGDIDDNGAIEIIESYRDSSAGMEVPWARWDVLAQSIPSLRAKFTGFKKYSETGVEALLGEDAKSLRQLEATTLESMVFLNRGDRFEPRRLPIEAQFAPAFGVCVADFDGDAHLDAFLGQNFFAVDPFTSRYDAGRGLLLKGDGRGGFHAVNGRDSGLLIYGEQRGAAVSDFDRDGRMDLAVAQNGAEMKLFRNQSAKPGLRVRLKGPPGNTTGVGAMVRPINGPSFGAAQEVHAGSGYWSQSSATLLVPSSSALTGLWVRWPGGKEIKYTVPTGATEVILGMDNRIDVAK